MSYCLVLSSQMKKCKFLSGYHVLSKLETLDKIIYYHSL